MNLGLFPTMWMRQRYDFHSNDLFPRFFSSSPAKIEVPAQKSRKVAGQFWPDKANSIPLDFTRLQLPFFRGLFSGEYHHLQHRDFSLGVPCSSWSWDNLGCCWRRMLVEIIIQTPADTLLYRRRTQCPNTHAYIYILIHQSINKCWLISK